MSGGGRRAPALAWRHRPARSLDRRRAQNVAAAAAHFATGAGARSPVYSRSTIPSGHVGFVGITHDVAVPGLEYFFSAVHLHGGPVTVRRFLPDLIDRIWRGTINPGKVFGQTLSLEQVADGYRAMDQRRAIKTLLVP